MATINVNMCSLAMPIVQACPANPVPSRRTGVFGIPVAARRNARTVHSRHVAYRQTVCTGSSMSGSFSEQPEDKKSSCPFSAVMDETIRSADGAAKTKRMTGAGLPIPKPSNIVQNARDVGSIMSLGFPKAILEFKKRYGPISRFVGGNTGFTFVTDPDNVQYVSTTNSKNYQDRFLPAVYTYVFENKGILGSQGEYNRRHRFLCQPPFLRGQYLLNFSSMITSKIADFRDVWIAAGGPTTDVSKSMQKLSLDVIGMVAFSHNFRGVDEERRIHLGGAAMEEGALVKAINETQHIMGSVFITPLPILKVLKVLKYPPLMKMKEAFQVIRREMTQIIEDRRTFLAAGGEPKKDLLEVLLFAKDEKGQGMTDDELWEDCHDIMGAGHDTTASSLTACIYMLGQNPDKFAKLVEEVDRVLQGRVPTYDDVDKLVYTQAVLKETMRLFPPIPLFPRIAKGEDMLPSGHKIPPGEVVLMSTFAMGRDPDAWPDVEAFIPERFLPEEEAKRHRFQYTPFGAGPRMCLGPIFAMMTMTLALSMLTQRFEFRPVSPTTPQIPFDYDIVMNFKEPVIMKVVPRKSGPGIATPDAAREAALA